MKIKTIGCLTVGVLTLITSARGAATGGAGGGGGGAASGGSAGAVGAAASGSAAAGAKSSSTAPSAPASSGNAINQTPGAAPAAPANQVQKPAQQGLILTNGVLISTNGLIVGTNGFLATNQFGFGTNGAGFGTNQAITFTNQFALSNIVALTNFFFNTNAVSFTNRLGLGPADTAITEIDRTLIITIRQRLFPLMRIQGGWEPISFLANQGMVTLFGEVISIQERQQIVTSVQNVPGVSRVVNGLFINPQLVRARANSYTGSISRFLQPASDPALGDYYMHSSASNRLGQRVYVPPSRGTIVATNQSLPGVNVTGPAFTNLSPTGLTNLQVPVSIPEILTNTNALTTPGTP